MHVVVRLATTAVVFAALASTAQAKPLTTAIFVPSLVSDPGLAKHFAATGATSTRIVLDWSHTAPAKRAAGFNPSDPDAAGYRWAAFDAALAAVAKAGLEPIVDIAGPPKWALAGTLPDPAELGRFALAAARRYDGSGEQPRVRYWEVWNEPNLATYLSPQLRNGQPVAPQAYRRMVNAVAGSVKSVHADNLVVAGGLAPFRDITPATLAQDDDWGPLSFMRALFCLSDSLQPTCHDPVRVDAWSMHPYTSGGPTHKAALPDDASLGDLGKVRKLLSAARRAGAIDSSGPLRLWVTEFSWDSSPPDPNGVPTALLKRWVPQALYELWRNGVSLVTWFTLRDFPLSSSLYQSGLYYESGKPKPYLQGFRFPFVAFPRARGVYVWGRTPGGLQARVAVEQRRGGRWRTVATLPSNADGIVQRTLHVPKSGSLRGRVVGKGRSLPFSLTAVPDRFFNPFGGTTILEPKG
jgi:hypothetical protein